MKREIIIRDKKQTNYMIAKIIIDYDKLIELETEYPITIKVIK